MQCRFAIAINQINISSTLDWREYFQIGFKHFSIIIFLYFYEVVGSLPLETEAHSGPRRLTSANQDQAAYLRSDHFLSNQSGFEQIGFSSH